MRKSIIDNLNKVLTNTLEYQEGLKKLANAGYDSETKKKLQEFAKIRKKQIEDLILIISKTGGDIESTERPTDHQVTSWLLKPQPESSEILKLLSFLIEAEKNSLEDYEDLLDDFELQSDSATILRRHQREAETTLHYLETAEETVERSKGLSS